MNARRRKLGSDHPDTLTSMANLTSTYWNQGRLDEAHSLLSDPVQAMQKVIGISHPTVLHHTEQLNKFSKVKSSTESHQVAASGALVCMHLFFNVICMYGLIPNPF